MKTKKDLAKYLADYIKHELKLDYIWDEILSAEILEQGLKAFESTEDASIDISIANHPRP